jgi:tetratricopeptide (TPR) repeat protein
MTPEEAIQVADEVLLAHAGKPLTDIQNKILRESLAGKGYESMEGHGSQHIKNEGKKLWDLLSKALGEKVSKTSFKVALEKRWKLSQRIPKSPQFSTYNPATFAGRIAETATLTACLHSSCRILAIAGMTGIGKTALAERVVANVMDTAEAAMLPYCRFSLDNLSLTPDFSSSGAALLRELGEEPTLADQQDSANLVEHILQRLNHQPCRLQIDSLERLLRGNEGEGWSEFCDSLWLDLLQKILAGTNCPSQLILTSQDIPGDLDAIASRYPQFWHCEPLQGLHPDEQRTLFQNLGLTLSDEDGELLQRIGAFYDGHPLVLQVIAEEIRQPPFQGNICQYWHHYAAEFTTTAPATATKLDRSRLFRRRVRQRVEQTIQRLPLPARQMLCASAVFRRPVPIQFWCAMRPNGDTDAAFDTLQDRHLIEYAPMPSSGERSRTTPLIRQHNLIRSVAYTLLKADPTIWEATERQAAHLWLTEYQPAPDAPNLETVRGYLEAFEHYCEMGNWEQAKAILIDQRIGLQLQTWGSYQEMIVAYQKLSGHLQLTDEVAIKRGLGNAYYLLSNYFQAIAYYEQSLNLAREIGDLSGEGSALGNLGTTYRRLGQYERAIYCHQKSLAIQREIGNRQGESNSLVNLGTTYNNLGQYELAIDCHQKSLAIQREIGDRQGESKALGNLGDTYDDLGQYERAIDCHQQYLTISQEIGDRRGEGDALGSLGVTYDNLGQYERAINYTQRYLMISREIGNRQGEGNALGNLGIVYNNLGQYERAIDFLQQCLTITRKIGDRRGESNALGSLGTAYNSLGQYERAIDLYQQQLMIAREIGNRRGEGNTLCNLGATQLKLEQYSESLTNTQTALEIFQEIGSRNGEAEVLKNLVELHQALGEVEVAWQYCQQALELATDLGIPLAEECQKLMEELEERGASEGK